MKENIIELDNKEKDILKSICRMCAESAEVLHEYNKQYIKRYTPEDILIQREKRVLNQDRLIERYNNTLINIRVNYPGIMKNNYVSLGIVKEICNLIISEFKDDILYKKFDITAEGPIINMIINKNAIDVKYKVVDIEENHFLGRCVDIDVYDKCGSGLSRAKLGLEQRKCYICNDIAQNCVRSRKHNISEIEEFINNKYMGYCKLSSL